VNDITQMVEHSADLVTSQPLAILVVAAIAAAIWSQRMLMKEREINRTLVRELLIAKSDGYNFSDVAEKTIIQRDQRQVPR
jgi:hypothetical protein